MLAKLYRSLNQLDLAGVPCCSRGAKLLLRGACRTSATVRMPTSRRRVDLRPLVRLSTGTGWTGTPRHISPPQPPTAPGRSALLKARYGAFEIPFSVPLDVLPEEVGEYSLVMLLTTFGHAELRGAQRAELHTSGGATHPLVVLFNALLTHKRVLFATRSECAHVVVQHVLAAHALASGSGAVRPRSLQRVFPYASLALVEELESLSTYIAGVTNPRFEELPLWDVLCRVDARTIEVQGERHAVKDATVPSGGSPVRFRSPWSGAERDGRRHTTRNSPSDPATARWTWPIDLSRIRSFTARRRHTTRSQAAAASDARFMYELQDAIEAHASEQYIRVRVQEYVHAFLVGTRCVSGRPRASISARSRFTDTAVPLSPGTPSSAALSLPSPASPSSPQADTSDPFRPPAARLTPARLLGTRYAASRQPAAHASEPSVHPRPDHTCIQEQTLHMLYTIARGAPGARTPVPDVEARTDAARVLEFFYLWRMRERMQMIRPPAAGAPGAIRRAPAPQLAVGVHAVPRSNAPSTPRAPRTPSNTSPPHHAEHCGSTKLHGVQIGARSTRQDSRGDWHAARRDYSRMRAQRPFGRGS